MNYHNVPYLDMDDATSPQSSTAAVAAEDDAAQPCDWPLAEIGDASQLCGEDDVGGLGIAEPKTTEARHSLEDNMRAMRDALAAFTSCKTCGTSRHMECNGRFKKVNRMFMVLGFEMKPEIKKAVRFRIEKLRDLYKFEGAFENTYVGQVRHELDEFINLILEALPEPFPTCDVEDFSQ